MSSTLNEKIRQAIDANVDAPFSTMGIDGVDVAAKEIEALILSEKIDLLKSIIGGDESLTEFNIDLEILNLNNQLNKLTK